jgi:glycosyltransferase involved in cell wall biosynthesis
MRRRLRLLLVAPRLPRRGVTAAQAYWWELLARLAPRHAITLLAFLDPGDVGGEPELPPGLAGVHTVPRAAWVPDDPMALLPTTVRGAFVDPALRAAIAERLAAERFDLVQYEYTEMAHLMPPAVVPTILTVHQLGFAAHLSRWRATGGGLRAGAVALFRHLRDLDFELRALGRVHHVIALSEEDRARLLRFLPNLRVSVSPVGVDCAYWSPPATAPPRGADVLFVGHFAHPPNPDAARFLVREIVPRLGRPVRVRLVGRAMPAEVAALAEPGAVEVVGPVADLRPELAGAAVVVAPVRFGTGMRGKVLEALAMARPVVATSVGAEGLGATSGRHLLIADGAEAFAAAVRRVLDDPAFAARLGQEGRALVESRFDWDAVAAAHEAIYERVLADPGPLPALPEGEPRPPALARLGRLPALALGAARVGARGLRWHLWRRPARGAATRIEPAAAGGGTLA